MHTIGRTETLLKSRCASRRVIHGSSFAVVSESPAGVPFERSPVAHEQGVAIDPEVERKAKYQRTRDDGAMPCSELTYAYRLTPIWRTGNHIPLQRAPNCFH